MRIRRRHLPGIAAAAAAVLAAGTFAVVSAASSGAATGGPVLIGSADPSESAAVKALMAVTGRVTLPGFPQYVYYVGTIDGHPVIDVTSEEMTETAEEATLLGDERFHPEATLWVGTAGANIAALHVGDVVLGGFVLEKYQVHNHDQSELAGAPSTFQTAYSGISVYAGPGTDVQGAIVDQTAAGHWEFVDALAGNLDLARVALKARVGSVSLADATGDPSKTGTVTNKVILGTEGQCNCWTEPLQDVSVQNALMPSDAEDNEDTGVAWANAEAGVPSLIIRDLSDSPWEPNAFDGKDSSAHGAAVVRYVVDHLPPRISFAPVTFTDLSEMSAARQYGYQIATRAFDDVTPVTRIDTSVGTMPHAQLAGLLRQYAFGRDGL